MGPKWASFCTSLGARRGQHWGDTDHLAFYRSTGRRYNRAVLLHEFYDPASARFVQPDTIVPNPGDPQSLNRYSYVGN